MRADKYIPLAFALSLLVHIFVVVLVWLVPSDFWLHSSAPLVSKIPVEKPSVIEVILNERKQKPQQQIVRQADAPESQLEDSNEPSRFLSQRKRRVILETKAKDVGKTQNRQTQALPRYQRELLERKIKEELKSLVPDTEGEIIVRPNSKNEQYKAMNLFPKDQFMKSTIGESLPDDVSIGDFTALNTDQYQFYTFYARVEDLVRFRWENHIRDSIEFFGRRNIIKSLSQKTWITQIEFLIDRNGHLTKAILLKESGVKQFDQASVRAFEDAKVFPNPPKEMIQSDGFIHLRYSFHVYFNPSYMAR